MCVRDEKEAYTESEGEQTGRPTHLNQTVNSLSAGVAGRVREWPAAVNVDVVGSVSLVVRRTGVMEAGVVAGPPFS